MQRKEGLQVSVKNETAWPLKSCLDFLVFSRIERIGANPLNPKVT